MLSWSKLTTFRYYEPFLANSIRIAVLILVAYAATKIIDRLVRTLYGYSVRVMRRAGGASEPELEKRAQTITGVIRKSMAGLLWCIVAIMVLKELNFDVRPLLAGAGVVGVALGFGAQSLVKDVISGLFLLMENQIRVNDVAVINSKSGLVEEINLRTTVLRGEDGAVHVFPNGSITTLSNLTRGFSYAVLSISVGYRENTDRVIDVVKNTAASLTATEPYRTAILEPLEVMGVDQLGDNSVTIKARFKTLPMQQWMIAREMNRRLKLAFEEAHIELPFPSQTIQLAPAVEPRIREEWKQFMREVMAENSGVPPAAGSPPIG